MKTWHLVLVCLVMGGIVGFFVGAILSLTWIQSLR